MRQYRITTDNIDVPQDNDCVIFPDDPLNDLKKQIFMDGLGSAAQVTAKQIDQFFEMFKIPRQKLPDPLTANEIKKLQDKRIN